MSSPPLEQHRCRPEATLTRQIAFRKARPHCISAPLPLFHRAGQLPSAPCPNGTPKRWHGRSHLPQAGAP